MQNQPENHEALNNLGVIHHTKGNIQEAEDYFLKALTVKKDYLDALLNLADLYQNAKRWEEAAVQLEKYIAIDNQDPNLFNQLGMVYLEMGNTEKARAVLTKSLELNPNQETVRDSLKALEGKREALQIQVTERPLNILFVQEAPCIRNYKMATALRSRGHRVSLAYIKAPLSVMYEGLSDDVYNECIRLESIRHMWEISKNYDIVHCHNEPDNYTVAALAGDTPVVHDTHDLVSLRANGNDSLSYFEGVANRGAAGRVYTTPYQLEEAKRLYGVEGPSLVLYNYVSAPDLPKKFLPKLSDQDGQVHIVYEGGIGGTSFRDFSSLFIELANQGIHIHIYPHFKHQKHDITPIFSKFDNIHLHDPLSPKQIMEKMTQYDFGIIPFNLKKGDKGFLNTTIANKLFEYLAAGLPVIASPLQSYVDYFKKNLIGITFENAQDIIENIPKLKVIAENTDFSKQIFTYEGEIGRLEQFYRKIMHPGVRVEDDRGQQRLQVNSQAEAVPCRICGSIRTKEIDKIHNLSVIFCQECEAYFAHPMSSDEFLRKWYSEEEKKKRWNNDLNLAIKANHEQNRYNYEEYFRIASETLNLDGRGKVLEIGCYSGLFLKKFKDLGYECKGIDLNEGFVRYGKENYGLDLECGTVFDFKFTEKYFDIIIFHQVLEHLSDPKSFLKEVRRILKDDGYIFLSVPNTGSIIFKLENKFLRDFIKHRFIDMPNHLFYFSKKSLKLLLKQTGFESSALTTFGSKESSKEILRKMGADDESLHAIRNSLIRSDIKPEWKNKDVELYVSRAILNAIHKESELLSKHLDDFPGLITIAKKTYNGDTGPGAKKVTDETASSIKKNLYPGIPDNLIIENTPHRPLLDLNKTQWLSTAELNVIQNAFLRMLVLEAYEKVPYYKKTMDTAGINPANVYTIEDLKGMPIIDKDTFYDHYAEMQHINFNKLRKHFTATGGSTGKTLKYFVPPEVFYYGLGCRNRGFNWAGFDENKDKVAYLAGASIGVTDKVELVGNKLKMPATGIINRSVLKKYYEALKSFSPNYMRAYPSALYQFCKFLKDEEKKVRLTAVVTTAEILYENQRSFIQEVLQCKVFNEYGTYDGGAGAFECENHSGMHLQMERGIIEILDDHGKPVPTGQVGRIVVTDLHNYLMPFIRYDVGDMAMASDAVCKCGRGLKLIERLEGRASDMLIMNDGTQISGTVGYYLFLKLLNANQIDVRQFQIIQKADRSIQVKVVPGPTYGVDQKNSIERAFAKHFFGLPVIVDKVADIEMPRSNKFRFVISEAETKKGDTGYIAIHGKKEKPKICHIGGAHSVHVADIVKELDQLGYEQCVISYYPVEKSITPNHIPVYYFPYRSYESPEWNRLKLEDKLEEFLDKVFKNEKPDIIHGHSLTYSCIPVWMAKEKVGLRTIIVPWSINTIQNPNKIANYYEKRCIETLDYFMHPMPNVFKLFQSYYGNLPDEKFVLFRALIDLTQYDKARAVSKAPKILSARVMGEYYRQDLLIRALPAIVAEFPETSATLIIGQNPEQGRPYFEKMIQLSRQLNVAQYCTFIPHELSQSEFSELIKSHNIIYSIATHDVGFAGTTVQAAYSGAITIVRDTENIDGVLDHGVNALRVQVDENSVREALLHAARNLEELQQRFIKNNRGLIVQGKRYMLKNLTSCYQRIFAQEKNSLNLECRSAKDLS